MTERREPGPRSRAIVERERRVAAVYDSPKPPPRRLTITPPVIAVARHVVVLATGRINASTSTPADEDRRYASVTLLVLPEEAEILTLAGNEGKIQLVLRNGTDQIFAKTQGRDLSELYGFRRNKPEPGSGVSAKVRAVPPPVRDVAPPVLADEIVVIRGTLKTVEVVKKPAVIN